MRILPMMTLPCLLLATACATISKDDKDTLAQAPRCSDPQAQIASVEALRPSKFKKARILTGYVTPEGLISGVLTKDFPNRKKILNGTYNREIDAKIAEIRTTCKLDPVQAPLPSDG